MLKPTKLAQAMALAMILPGVAVAEFEISGEAKIEYSVFTKDGQVTGAAEPHESMDAMKSEPSIKLFINSDVGEESAFHAEVLFADDGEAASSRLEGGESYSQYEFLREFYFDTVGAGWDWRLGKQQVVWGTADGMKLLDIINPTDYRELNQNTSEDSRIPVWMINAEKYLDNGSNIQVIVSEARPNFIAGMDEDSDSGAPFLFKGVDSITGKVNGFLNVAPALSQVAANFTNASVGGLFGGNPNPVGLTNFTGVSVEAFTSTTIEYYTNGTPTSTTDDYISMPGIPGYTPGGGDMQLPGSAMLSQIAQQGLFTGDPNANNGVTNLMPDSGYNAQMPTSAFEYMPNATFATFNTFSGLASGTPGAPAGFATEYVQEHKDETNVNWGGRYKASTDGGMNYSLNYFHHYGANPAVNMSWHDSATGEELTVVRLTSADEVNNSDFSQNPDTYPDFVDTTSASLSPDQIPNSFATVSVLLQNSAGQYYGKFNPNPYDGVTMSSNDPVLRFTESTYEVNSIGTSFDMALEGTSVPVVIRGEFLYDAGEKQPVIDKRLLAIGDLANSLTMQDADLFKYVLGVDVTVMTNLLVSTQLIQTYNLDYIDEKRTCTSQGDLALGGTGGKEFDCSKYTGDFSTLSMPNALNKGDEVETFVSFFLSKPFGSDVQHRWNNIIIAENGGGYWNRFDVEYSFNDEMVGTVEYNKYWGDEDTTFGQFENSSNLQLGFKFIF